jgi:hypothetical protein
MRKTAVFISGAAIIFILSGCGNPPGDSQSKKKLRGSEARHELYRQPIKHRKTNGAEYQ